MLSFKTVGLIGQKWVCSKTELTYKVRQTGWVNPGQIFDFVYIFSVQRLVMKAKRLNVPDVYLLSNPFCRGGEIWSEIRGV